MHKHKNNNECFKLPYIVEREDAKSRLIKFFEYLPDKKRGVLRISGFSRSGRTYFLEIVEHVAVHYNYEVISLVNNFRIKTKEIVDLQSRNGKIKLNINDISEHYIDSLLSKVLINNQKSGLIIIVDDIFQFSYENIELLCNVLNNQSCYNIALVYSNEPKALKYLDFIDSIFYETISLSPLSPQGLRLLINEVFSWDPPNHFLEWFYNETMGMPGLIKDGVSYLSREGVLINDTAHGFVIAKDYSDFTINSEEKNKSIRRIKCNLPASLNEFVGRKNDIEKINNLLDVARIVTLTGSGGIGKTRLALQVASMRLYNYNDGVFFVQLSSVSKVDSISSIIAKTLNITEITGQHILDTLKNVLKEKNCLIIFDNFEHVIEDASIVFELLTCAQGLTILATSREPLRISGEYLFCVPPFDFLNLKENIPVEKLVEQPAIALFLLRSKAVKPDFEITEQNKREVIELCSSLEGIPLAIELAAANMGQTSIQKMIDQNQNRLEWLNNGVNDLGNRQRTLRNTIEWGYNLLNEDQKIVFKRLAVFTGKFDLEAADSITNYQNDIEDLSYILNSLVSKSLLNTIQSTIDKCEVRFGMLETIREYVIELLSKSNEEKFIKDSHSNYYLEFVVKADRNMNSQDRQIWLEKLEFSHSNILEALKHFQITNNIKKELKLAGTMGYFWEIRGYWTEGVSILESLVKRYGNSIKSKDYIKVYGWLGRLTHLQGKPEKSISILKDCLSLAREIGDSRCEADTLYKLSLAVSMQGNLSEEEKLAQKSLEKFKEAEYTPGVAEVLQHLSLLYYQKGYYKKAQNYSNQSLKIFRELNDRWGMSRALWRLGLVARSVGSYDKAMDMIDEYLACCKELDDKEGIANALISIAELLRSQGKYDIAENYYMEALNVSNEIGYKALIGRVLKDIGEIYRYKSNFVRAMELYEKSLDVLTQIGSKGDIAWLYRNMAELELQTGDFLKAEELYLKGLNVFCDSKENTIIFVFLVLGGLAAVSTRFDKLDRGARLFGAAERLRNITGNVVSKSDLSEYEKHLAELKNKMEKNDFEKAWNEGSQMSVDMAIDYASENIKDNKFEKSMASKMMNFIHLNFTRDISLDEISDFFNMTPAYFCTMFKYYTGYNYRDYLNSYRVKVAKDLLHNSNLKIKEVSEKVGYVNVNTFIRIFKKYEGMSPGQYSP